jgi:flagellar basal-body rod protein FlgB
MINALFSQPSYVASKVSLDTTALRAEAISSNIANLEKPGYKRIDVAPTFQAELNRAISSHDISKMAGLQPQLAVDSTAIAGNRDGNTVQLETELLNLSQNTMAHTLETQLVSGSLSQLRSAITARSA